MHSMATSVHHESNSIEIDLKWFASLQLVPRCTASSAATDFLERLAKLTLVAPYAAIDQG